MNDDLQSLSYLWEDGTGRYVLVQAVSGGQSYDTCVVYDLESKTGLLIENDDLADEVKRRMAEKGVPMLPDLPR
ncbi:MAG: hypothetical protein U0871_28290 [Gemmataceae bacterium]